MGDVSGVGLGAVVAVGAGVLVPVGSGAAVRAGAAVETDAGAVAAAAAVAGTLVCSAACVGVRTGVGAPPQAVPSRETRSSESSTVARGLVPRPDAAGECLARLHKGMSLAVRRGGKRTCWNTVELRN